MSDDRGDLRRRRRLRWALGVGGAAVASAAIGTAAIGASETAPAFPTGSPPELAANASAFPAANYTYANDRNVTSSKINAGNIGTLKEAWRFTLTGKSAFGVFSSNPIITEDAVYLQDINSNVFKLDRDTGKLLWQQKFNAATTGPNGVSIGYGKVFGGTNTDAFALDDATGNIVWRRRLIRQKSEGLDIQPLVWNNMVIISTVPGAALSNFYGGGGKGIVSALDVNSGAVKWQFDTTTDNLWGNPKVNSGGGAWYTPSVDAAGSVYVPVANPAPWPGVPKFPNGSSRPGKNLYTNSLVAVDGNSGKVQWYWQALSHDLRDWDLQLPPILTSFTVNGKPTDVAVLSGKLGTVYVVDRTTHKLLWKRDVGMHNGNGGTSRNQPFGKLPQKVYPGWLGGVETPMAVSDGVIYAPVNNLCAIYERMDNFTKGSKLCDFATSSGEIVALDGASGKVLWSNKVAQQNYGGATVVNDLVLTVWFDGKIRAYDKKTGKLVYEQQTPAAANAEPAVAEDMIVVVSGYAAKKSQTPSVVAYKLS